MPRYQEGGEHHTTTTIIPGGHLGNWQGLHSRVRAGPRLFGRTRIERDRSPHPTTPSANRKSLSHTACSHFRFFELSLQSPLHRSIALLVRYRSCAHIQPHEANTSYAFKLQSQEALLADTMEGHSQRTWHTPTTGDGFKVHHSQVPAGRGL